MRRCEEVVFIYFLFSKVDGMSMWYPLSLSDDSMLLSSAPLLCLLVLLSPDARSWLSLSI